MLCIMQCSRNFANIYRIPFLARNSIQKFLLGYAMYKPLEITNLKQRQYLDIQWIG